MTHDEIVKKLKIDPSAHYTYGEVATIMHKEVRTIRTWCNVGFKTKRHGIVTLDRFVCGRDIAIPGSCLIEFLRKIQRTN